MPALRPAGKGHRLPAQPDSCLPGPGVLEEGAGAGNPSQAGPASGSEGFDGALGEASPQGQAARGALLLGLVTGVEASMCVIWTPWQCWLGAGPTVSASEPSLAACPLRADVVWWAPLCRRHSGRRLRQSARSGPVRPSLRGSPSPRGQWAEDSTGLFQESGAGCHKLRLPG